jgi:hypothetical protein
MPFLKADPQAVGSAITYARRYALAAIVGIVADDDDDGNQAAGKSHKEDVAMINDGQKATLRELKVKKSDIKAIIGKEISNFSQMSYDEAERVIAALVWGKDGKME